MLFRHPADLGTCVIGELGDSAAFASVAAEGTVWAKRYSGVDEAVSESRRLGLVDRLFAVAAPRYIQESRTPCLSPLARKVNPKKLEAAGFRRTDAESRFQRAITHSS